MGPAEAASISVVVVYSPGAGAVDETPLQLPATATLVDALNASGLAGRHPQVDFSALKWGVWGKLRQPSDGLRERDRVEFYRPLQVDPKEARRVRYRQHRERYGAK